MPLHAHTLYFSSSPASQENLKEGKNTCFREICVKTLKRYVKPTDTAQEGTRLFGWEYFHPLSEDHVWTKHVKQGATCHFNRVDEWSEHKNRARHAWCWMLAQALACCEFGKVILHLCCCFQIAQKEVIILICSEEYCEVINSSL